MPESKKISCFSVQSNSQNLTTLIQSNEDSPIGKADLRKLLKADFWSVVSIERFSSTKCFACLANGFQILDDSVFAVQGGGNYMSPCTLVRESFSGNRLQRFQFGNHKSKVLSLLVDHKLNSLFAGDEHGKLVQYNLQNGKIIKDYGLLHVGALMSIASWEGLMALGGFYQKIVFVNVKKTQVLNVMPTAIGNILSLHFCPLVSTNNNPKLLLTVTGLDSDYEHSKTDVFDVTAFKV